MSDLTPADCARKIDAARRVAALTGAGVSTAAGIPDFRGPQGLYVTRRYDPDTVFDINAFRQDPLPFFDFSRDFLRETAHVEPTFTHRFLADLEATDRLAGVITQNIDALHEQAGSRRVLPVHGNYWTSHCQVCGRAFDFETLRAKVAAEPVPCCSCGGVIKPDVVFFGEPVRDLHAAQKLVVDSDLLLVLGSSLAVHPAALIPQFAGGEVVVVNHGPVGLASAPGRFFVDEDLDGFFRAVADAQRGA